MDFTVIQNAATKIVDNFKSVGNDIANLDNDITNLRDNLTRKITAAESDIVEIDDDLTSIEEASAYVCNCLSGELDPEDPNSGYDELADIRVGYDGTSYDKAGIAVREQVSQLASEIANVYSNVTEVKNTIPQRYNMYGDIEYMNALSPQRMGTSGYIIARYNKTTEDCYVNKILLHCGDTDNEKAYKGCSVQVCKFKLNGTTISNSTVENLAYSEKQPCYNGENEILLYEPFYVDKDYYIGVLFTTTDNNTISIMQVLTEFENSGSILINTTNNSAKGYPTYTNLVDFELINKTYLDNAKNVLRGKTYVAYGDSITAGFGVSDDYTATSGQTFDFNNNKVKSYVRQLADKHGMKFYNYGFAGYGYSRNPVYASNVIENAHIDNADIITIAYGTNDYGVDDETITPFGSVSDTSEQATFCGYVKKAFDKLTEYYPLAKIFVILPIARYNMGANSQGKTLNDYCNAIEEIASYYGFATLRMLRESNINIQSQTFCYTYFAEQTKENALHLNYKGHNEIMLPIIENFILNSF